MPSQTIQWFPGHMAKTRRLISENLKEVDVVIELLDARIPYSSRNPEIAVLVGEKPLLTLLNKASLANPSVTKEWISHWKAEGRGVLAIDCITGEGLSAIGPAVRELLKEKLERWEKKGLQNKHIKAMMVGIPNVGKSSLINRISGTKKVKVEDRPGVTLNKQWVTTSAGFDLMDMPGILWPKFEDQIIGENLAATGAIKDAILDTETLAAVLAARLATVAPDAFRARYKLDDITDKTPWELLHMVGKKRGCLISGGEIDTERTAAILLDEFRGGKIGRISLERP